SSELFGCLLVRVARNTEDTAIGAAVPDMPFLHLPFDSFTGTRVDTNIGGSKDVRHRRMLSYKRSSQQVQGSESGRGKRPNRVSRIRGLGTEASKSFCSKRRLLSYSFAEPAETLLHVKGTRVNLLTPDRSAARLATLPKLFDPAFRPRCEPLTPPFSNGRIREMDGKLPERGPPK